MPADRSHGIVESTWGNSLSLPDRKEGCVGHCVPTAHSLFHDCFHLLLVLLHHLGVAWLQDEAHPINDEAWKRSPLSNTC